MNTSRRSVNVYDYPEHLNPFYENDNHNRLRFWDRGKKIIRANSFSISDIKRLPRKLSFRNKSGSPNGFQKREPVYPIRRNVYENHETFQNNTAQVEVPIRPSSSLGICETERPTPRSCTLPRKKKRAPLPPSQNNSTENIHIQSPTLPVRSLKNKAPVQTPTPTPRSLPKCNSVRDETNPFDCEDEVEIRHTNLPQRSSATKQNSITNDSDGKNPFDDDEELGVGDNTTSTTDSQHSKEDEQDTKELSCASEYTIENKTECDAIVTGDTTEQNNGVVHPPSKITISTQHKDTSKQNEISEQLEIPTTEHIEETNNLVISEDVLIVDEDVVPLPAEKLIYYNNDLKFNFQGYDKNIIYENEVYLNVQNKDLDGYLKENIVIENETRNNNVGNENINHVEDPVSLLEMVQKLQLEVQKMTFDDFNDNLVHTPKNNLNINDSEEIKEFEKTAEKLQRNSGTMHLN